jgi:hypothetical protein
LQLWSGTRDAQREQCEDGRQLEPPHGSDGARGDTTDLSPSSCWIHCAVEVWWKVVERGQGARGRPLKPAILQFFRNFMPGFSASAVLLARWVTRKGLTVPLGKHGNKQFNKGQGVPSVGRLTKFGASSPSPASSRPPTRVRHAHAVHRTVAPGRGCGAWNAARDPTAADAMHADGVWWFAEWEHAILASVEPSVAH